MILVVLEIKSVVWVLLFILWGFDCLEVFVCFGCIEIFFCFDFELLGIKFRFYRLVL